jgi:hypothetical protein
MLSSTELLWTLFDLHFPGECRIEDRQGIDPQDLFWKKSKRWLAFLKGRPYRRSMIPHSSGVRDNPRLGPATITYKAGRIAWVAEENCIRVYQIASGHRSQIVAHNRAYFQSIFLADSVLAALTFGQ